MSFTPRQASQVHAWQSAVNTVNITRNKTLNIEYNKEVLMVHFLTFSSFAIFARIVYLTRYIWSAEMHCIRKYTIEVEVDFLYIYLSKPFFGVCIIVGVFICMLWKFLHLENVLKDFIFNLYQILKPRSVSESSGWAVFETVLAD